MTVAPPTQPPKLTVSWRLVVVFAVVAAALAAMTGPLPPHEQADTPAWVIPAHQEDAVLKWLGPLTDGAQITPAWRVADVAIETTGLRLHLRDGSDQPGPWASVRLDCAPPKLVLDLPQGLPADVVQAVQVNAAALRLPGPFLRSQPAVRPPPMVPWRVLALAYFTLRFFSVFVAFLAALWFVRRVPRTLWLPYLGLTVLGAILRAWLSPANFLHEFYHVDESLSMLAGQPGFFNGHGGPALYSALVPWLRWDPTWMFAVNACAATLTVPALGCLAGSVWRDPRAGLVAALLLALSPLHLRWSAGEDQWTLATAWAVLALAAGLDALESDDWLALLVGVLASVLAAQARMELLPFPALLVVFALVRGPSWLRAQLSQRTAWTILAVATLAAWPIVLLLLNRPQPPQATLEHMKIWRDLQWRNVAWTPLPLQIVSLGAITLAVVRRNLSVLLLVAASLLWVGLPMVFYGAAGPFLERTQLFSGALALVVTAGVFPPLLQAVPPRIWFIGLLLAGLVAVHDRRAAITALTGQQQEWNFLRDHLPLRDPPKRLLGLSGRSLDRFPIMLFPDAIAPQLLDQEQVVQSRNWPLPGRDLVYYQSMRCWFAEVDEPPVPLGMHPLCAAVHDHYVLEPLDVIDLPGPIGPMLLPLARGPYPIGFFRLVDVRSAHP